MRMNTYRPLRLTDTMPFGKHKGEQIEDLIYDHPSYMTWLCDESTVVFDEEVTKILEDEKLI